jgi:hypothetical protein
MAPPEFLGTAGTEGVDFAFDAAKEQAAVVGGEVVSFVKGITAEQRADVVNATLLAQLIAKKKLPEPKNLDDILAWYRHYFDALSQIGFVTQGLGFAEYVDARDTFEAHQAIIEVATALLAGSPGALVVIKKALEALQKMSGDSPWITLFNKESRSAETAHFQASMVSTDDSGPFLISIVAFGIKAESKVTQVLFFKFRKDKVKLVHHQGKVSINTQVLEAIRQDVAQKLVAATGRAYTQSRATAEAPQHTAQSTGIQCAGEGGGAAGACRGGGTVAALDRRS